jgi:phage terminase small subunit
MGEAQGNGTFAAKLAGYSGNNVTLGAMACETLKNPRVKRAIAQMTESDPLIATRAQRQAFWTEVMQSPESEMKDRLKASELLGKTQADFVERREVVGDVAVEHEHRHKHTVDLSQLTDEELRVLEKVIGKVGES